MIKKSRVTAMVVIACLAIAISVFFLDETNLTAIGVFKESTNVASINATGISATNDAEPSTFADSDSGKKIATSSRLSDPFPGVRKDRRGMSLQDDPFMPTSIEEQRWLDRNGFPNKDQLYIYTTATDEALAQAAAIGDKVAGIMLDGRKLIQGDPEAKNNLWNAAANGSGFALTTLAGFLGGSRTDGDPAEAYAISRVAEMRGDYRQALTRDMIVQKPLDPAARLEAEARAMNLFNNLTQTRRARFGPNVPTVDPRPIAPGNDSGP